MEKLSFVNIYGQPLSIPTAIQEPTRPKPKKRTVTRRQRSESYHKGWRVLGVSPEQVSAARWRHERDRICPFNEARWIEKARPKRARDQDFESQEAAREYAALARQAGWHRVEVKEVSRGIAQDYMSILFGPLLRMEAV